MLTYFIYKRIIYDIFILESLYNIYGTWIDSAMGLCGAIFLGIVGILFILADIVFIPFYLLIGFWVVIRRFLDFIVDFFEKRRMKK